MVSANCAEKADAHCIVNDSEALADHEQHAAFHHAADVCDALSRLRAHILEHGQEAIYTITTTSSNDICAEKTRQTTQASTGVTKALISHDHILAEARLRSAEMHARKLGNRAQKKLSSPLSSPPSEWSTVVDSDERARN